MLDIISNIDFESLFGFDIKKDVLNILYGSASVETFRKPPEIDTSTKISFTNDVYLNNTYKGQRAVVKKIPVEEKSEVIMEVIVHALFYEITKNKLMRAPKPLALFKDDGHFYFFQQQVGGKYVHDLKAQEMRQCLMTITSELAKLQKEYEFMHKDFKSDNILYNKGIVYIIDFGFSCIGPLGFRKCLNNSADICFLLLSIYLNLGRSPKPSFIKELVNAISCQLNKDMPEDCDISEENDCVCFQDAVYDYKQMDDFLPLKIYTKLKGLKF